MKNLEYKKGEQVSADEILEMYVADKENLGESHRQLSRNSLSRIINDIWEKDGVRVAKLRHGVKRLRCYLNLKKTSNEVQSRNQQVDRQQPLTMSIQAVAEEISLPNNWHQIINGERSFSVLRLEQWLFNGCRMINEIKVTYDRDLTDLYGDSTIELISQGTRVMVHETELWDELQKSENIKEKVQLLMALIDSQEIGICCGYHIPPQQDYLAVFLPHTVAEINNEIKCAFSKDCKILSVPGQSCSSCSFLKKRECKKLKTVKPHLHEQVFLGKFSLTSFLVRVYG